MSEEEKESIEQLKSWRAYIIKHKEETKHANDLEFYLKTVLNLIEKQQKELDKKDKIIDEMAAFIDRNGIYMGMKCRDDVINHFTKKVEG